MVLCPVVSTTGLVSVGCPVGSVTVVLSVTNLDVDGDPDTHGDEMAMMKFVAVLGTFAFCSTLFQDVIVVVCATNFKVHRDRDADVFVALLGTLAFVGTYFGDARLVLHDTILDVDGYPDADGDDMAMVEFVAVFSTFGLVLTYFGEVGQDLFFNKNLFN